MTGAEVILLAALQCPSRVRWATHVSVQADGSLVQRSVCVPTTGQRRPTGLTPEECCVERLGPMPITLQVITPRG